MDNNNMRDIRVAKVTLNVGVGEPGIKLENAKKILNLITGKKALVTSTNKRIPAWGVRPKLQIGCKVTVRGDGAVTLLKNLMEALEDNRIKESQFDNHGNFAFGVKEYIHIPGIKYQPELGIFGLDVCVTLERPGYRIKRRRLRATRVPVKHNIKKEEAIRFVKEKLGVRVE